MNCGLTWEIDGLMRTWVLMLALLLFSTSTTDAQTVRGHTGHRRYNTKRPEPRAVYVAICESRSAYAYHAGMCRGLARCTHGVSKVTVAQARNAGYVPCTICY